MVESADMSFDVVDFGRFLADFSFLVDFSVVDMIEAAVWRNLPDDWLQCFFYSPLPGEDSGQDDMTVLHSILKSDPHQSVWPESLRLFVDRCRRLQLVCKHGASGDDEGVSGRPGVLCVSIRCGRCDGADGQCYRASATLTDSMWGVAAKKQHELQRLLPFVAGLCEQTGADTVLDIGAGLGHLGECLWRQYGLASVGVECDPARVQTARRRLTVTGSAVMSTVAHFVVHDHTRVEELTKLVSNHVLHRWVSVLGRVSGDERVRECAPVCCWTGLHACGPLSTTLLRLYVEAPPSFARCLALLSCCYHKSEHRSTEWRPLSSWLRQLCSSEEDGLLNAFALRLACQQSPSGWCRQNAAQHAIHARAVLWRNLLGRVASATSAAVGAPVIIRNCRRHAVHAHTQFITYASSMLQVNGVALLDAIGQERISLFSDQWNADNADRVCTIFDTSELESRCGFPWQQLVRLLDSIRSAIECEKCRDIPSETILLKMLSTLGTASESVITSDSGKTSTYESAITPDSGKASAYESAITSESGKMSAYESAITSESGSTSAPDGLALQRVVLLSIRCVTRLLKCRRCERMLLWRVELISALQACIQPVLEALLLLDRAAFLQQQPALSAVRLVQLFDSCQSPRAWCLVSSR